MTALLVVPDYLSHYLPMAAVGTAMRGRGHEVVVATGQGLAARVRADGFEHRELRLGASRNTGVAPAGEQARLRAFLDSTRAGAFATLRHQAEQRRHDLLWEPVAVAERLAAILDELEPELVVSDQLAYGASVALRALGRPFASFLPGHPSQLPLPGETFGVPPRFPPGLAPTAAELTELRSLAAEVARDFTHAFNDALRLLEPRAAPVDDAFGAGSPWLTLVAYPAALARRWPAELVGPCVRDPEGTLELPPTGRPRVYVALGTFLSAREDVLGRIAAAVRLCGWDAVVATGAADPGALGGLPPGWHAAPRLPQVAALAGCDAAVCHGGNNTVMEALAAGLPVLCAPFSTDQFTGAEDLRRAGLGAAFDPNRATPQEIAGRLRALLEGPPRAIAAALGRRLRARPGRDRAARLVTRTLARRPVVARPRA